MDELSDDECNLLRYCAETERIVSSMGQMRGAFKLGGISRSINNCDPNTP
jgi:hypothetical protein